MEKKNFGGLMIALILIAFGCGLLAMGNAVEFHKLPVSQETVDSIARDEARARIARDNESARNNEQIKFLALVVVTMAAALFAVPMSFMLAARGAGHWNRRHDRAPDFAGNYALVRDDARLVNPNIGLQIAQPVSEATMIALAEQRGMVHATQAAFHGGIERNDARARQRATREPDGWTVTTPDTQPQQPAMPAPEFVLVDDKGERQLTTTFASEVKP